jgi:hypothetical protein
LLPEGRKDRLKKKIKVLLCAFQALLVVMLFAPTNGGGNVRSPFEVVNLYNGQGYGWDVRVFLFLALGIPLAIVLSMFLLKERKNYGFGACLGALLTFTYAVFYEVVKAQGSIPLNVFVKARFYFLTLLALLTMVGESVAFLITPPQEEEKE